MISQLEQGKELWSKAAGGFQGQRPGEHQGPGLHCKEVLVIEWLSPWKQNWRFWDMSAATAKSLQSCPTVWPHRRQPPGSPIPGILQARTLEWVAISFSNAWKWKVKVKLLSRVQLFTTPWTAAYQAPPSMGFSKQEYWSGVPLPSPWDMSDLS